MSYSTETLDRIKKLERMRALGVNPYATRFDIIDNIGNILKRYPSNIDPTLQESNTPTFRKIEDIIPSPSSTVALAGRVMLHRSFGKICFATLSDGTGRIQVLFSRENCSINVNGIRHTELVSVSSDNS
jgi:lysyl-tRNA synthetase class 2